MATNASTAQRPATPTTGPVTAPVTADEHQLDVALTELATTLLDPHQHTPHTALAALAAAAPGVPAALADGYTVPDLTHQTPAEPCPAPDQPATPGEPVAL